jgi:hypothetical protein
VFAEIDPGHWDWLLIKQKRRYLVIKTLAYFPSQCAQNSVPVLQAFLAGLRHHGIQPVENSTTADAAVIWSVLWRGRMQPNQSVFESYRARGCPVVIIDIGTLIRGITWKVAINHITARGHYAHHDDLDPDRPRKLGLRLERSQLKSQVLIALQNDRSLQVKDILPLDQWLRSKITELRRHTDREILIRPHPRCRIDLAWVKTQAQISSPRRLVHTYDSFDLDCAYHAVINHNSGPGIWAAISGSRPIVDSSSLAWPVAQPMHQIEDAYDLDREPWLRQISHTEYTLEEIAQALWLKRLKKYLVNDL